MADNQPDIHFRLFRKQLEDRLAHYHLDEDERSVVERQKQQLARLISLEDEFRKTLIKHPEGGAVYRDFVLFITGEKHNILAARPYFRERQQVFTDRISVELKKGNERGLYPFHVNYSFVKFVLESRAWPAKSKIAKLAAEIAGLRKELAEMNMPLAINRSRIFWKKTPESHLEYMDLVQIAAEGLMVAIDKFCWPSEDKGNANDKAGWAPFRHMSIGRMVGFLIEQYSETMVHFFPGDKRKIYRGNKAIHRLEQENGGIDWQRLADEVNKGAREDQKTDANEIADLMAGTSCVSADAQPVKAGGDEDSGNSFLDRFSNTEEELPDHLAEESEALHAMHSAIGSLTPFEVKYLRLRGVELLR